MYICIYTHRQCLLSTKKVETAGRPPRTDKQGLWTQNPLTWKRRSARHPYTPIISSPQTSGEPYQSVRQSKTWGPSFLERGATHGGFKTVCQAKGVRQGGHQQHDLSQILEFHQGMEIKDHVRCSDFFLTETYCPTRGRKARPPTPDLQGPCCTRPPPAHQELTALPAPLAWRAFLILSGLVKRHTRHLVSWD